MTDTHLPGLPGPRDKAVLLGLAPSTWSPPTAPWQPETIKLPARTPHPTIPLFDLTEEVCEAASVAEREAIVEDLYKAELLHLPFNRIAIKFRCNAVSKEIGWKVIDDDYTVTAIVQGELSMFTAHAVKPKNPDDLNAPQWHSDWNADELEAKVLNGEAQRRRLINVKMGAQMYFETSEGGVWINLNDAKEVFEKAADKDADAFMRDHHALVCEAITILLASLACKNVVREVSHNGQIGRGAHAIPVYASSGTTFISMTRVRPPTMTDGHSGVIMKPHMRRGHQHTVVHGKGRTGRRLQWFDPCYVGYDPAYAPPQPHNYVVTP
jgi:hypothetical protein